MVFILGSFMTFEQFARTLQAAYSKDLVDTSSMLEAELQSIITLLRQGSVSTVDINKLKLRSTSEVILAEVDYGQLSSYELSSQ